MPSNNANVPIEILLVEDSPDDADLMQEALLAGNLSLRVSWVEDGEQAMDYLHRRGSYGAAPRPDLILLDLRLPRKNGQEVLEEIRQEPRLRLIPVVILTSNDAAIPALYDYHPNCCVAKPADQEQFRLVVQKIERFWLTVAARAPHRNGTSKHATGQANKGDKNE
jgi:CheY-like chemotaxis protein